MAGIQSTSAALKRTRLLRLLTAVAAQEENIIAARLVPTATRGSNPKTRVSVGTNRNPPPRPIMAPIIPIAHEIKNAKSGTKHPSTSARLWESSLLPGKEIPGGISLKNRTGQPGCYYELPLT